MKLKNIKKHVKKVKLTMKFDNLEAMNSMYKRVQNIAYGIATEVPSSYIRVECFEKRKKIVVTASGREFMERYF